MWYLHQFRYTEFDNDVQFFCFEPELLFLERLDSNYQSYKKFCLRCLI